MIDGHSLNNNYAGTGLKFLGDHLSVNNIKQIEIPSKLVEKGYDLETYVQMFLTTSYVLTAVRENCQKILNIFQDHHMYAVVIGSIKNEFDLSINNGKNSIKVIDFKHTI